MMRPLMAGALLALAAHSVAQPPEPTIHGKATWYCCTKGYRPSDMVAAIDRKDAPWRKGDRVRVTAGERSVVVRIVDVCACKGRRVIDLSSGAFLRLAPLSRGVIRITLEAA